MGMGGVVTVVKSVIKLRTNSVVTVAKKSLLAQLLLARRKTQVSKYMLVFRRFPRILRLLERNVPRTLFIENLFSNFKMTHYSYSF